MKLFVWDFHGVLEKGNEYAVVEVTNQVLEEFRKEARLSMDLCLNLYGKKWSKFFKQLCPEENEDTIEKMVNRGVEISKTTDIIFKYTKPMEHSHEVLIKIKEEGHENMVISNTEPNALDRYLKSVEITSFVNHKIGADLHRKGNIFENLKIKELKKFLELKNYDKIIVIGDRKKDIEMGKAVNAVTYLFRGRDEVDADHKISDLREVLKELYNVG